MGTPLGRDASFGQDGRLVRRLARHRPTPLLSSIKGERYAHQPVHLGNTSGCY
jgi:hypothetical protein